MYKKASSPTASGAPKHWKNDFAASGIQAVIKPSLTSGEYQPQKARPTVKPAALDTARCRARDHMLKTRSRTSGRLPGRRSADPYARALLRGGLGSARSAASITPRATPRSRPTTSSFARPKLHVDAPLRTSFLEGHARRGIPLHATRSALLGTLDRTNAAHMSYDIDGDGMVDCVDYQLSKQFDTDGDGVIDAEERKLGQRLISSTIADYENDVLSWRGKPRRTMKQTNVRRDDICADPEHFTRTYSHYRKGKAKFKNTSGHLAKHSIFPESTLIDHREFGTTYTQCAGKTPTARNRETRARCSTLSSLKNERKKAYCELSETIGRQLKEKRDMKSPERPQNFKRYSALASSANSNFSFIFEPPTPLISPPQSVRRFPVSVAKPSVLVHRTWNTLPT